MTFDAFQCEIMVVKFVWRSVHGKHLRDFNSENIVFKFLQRRVDGTLGTRGFSRAGDGNGGRRPLALHER